MNDAHGQNIVTNVLTATCVRYASHVLYHLNTVNPAKYVREPQAIASCAADIEFETTYLT